MRNLLNMLTDGSAAGSGLGAAVMQMLGRSGGRSGPAILEIGGLPMLMDLGDEDVGGSGEATILYQTDKGVCTVRDGVCQQEKTVAGFVGINAHGMFCCGVLIYANAEDDEPQATWEVCPRQNKVLSALRTIDLLLNHCVEISQRTVELTYVAVVGGPNRAALRDEVGHDTFDTILTEGPDGLDTILKQLDERRIPFDKQEVTDAMRNGGVEPSDELTTLGIETPQQWDARVSSEKKMEAALGPHFTKLARTLNFRVTPLCLKTLQNFAELAQKKGVADQATLIGVAGALYIVTHGGEQRLGDMTTDVLTGELSNHRSEIGKVAKFLKTRFPAVQKTAEDHQGEISKIVEEWDMKQDADLTASAVEVAPYVQV